MIYIVPLILYIELSERESRERSETANPTVVATGLFTASLGTVMGASLLYYGNPLPNTFYLRASGTPYFRDGPALDVLGKMDSHIARLRVDRFETGHSKWDWDYNMDKRPEACRELLLHSRGCRRSPTGQ
jgi:hypothetical protein